MFQNRDEIRQVYLTVWQKLQNGQILEPMESVIADIIQLHPEYHSILQQGQSAQNIEFNPESGNSNPFLHMGMHIALREQTSIDRPAGIKRIHHKLSKKKGQHDAEHAMIECLGQALWLAQQNNTMPDETAYLNCLKKI
ncbi:MAG: DUF1841 family protein [Gammaproteobacteria bacterium]|nr:DUF1841 family protein [Gammaproteobacteria bacterium]